MSDLPDGFETRDGRLEPETVVWLLRDGQRVRNSTGEPLWFLDAAEARLYAERMARNEADFRTAMRTGTSTVLPPDPGAPEKKGALPPPLRPLIPEPSTPSPGPERKRRWRS